MREVSRPEVLRQAWVLLVLERGEPPWLGVGGRGEEEEEEREDEGGGGCRAHS